MLSIGLKQLFDTKITNTDKGKNELRAGFHDWQLAVWKSGFDDETV